MRVAVTGGTGQLGSVVTRALAARRHEVIMISRNAPSGSLPGGVEHRRADFATGEGIQACRVWAADPVTALYQ